MNIIYIFVGGGVGAVSRFLLSRTLQQAWTVSFPLGTLAVNLIGCYLIGLCYGFFEKFLVHSGIRLFLIIGFLGGFTTFSSFGMETVNLLRSKEYPAAVWNILLNNIAGITLVVLGVISAYGLNKLLVKGGN